MFYFFTVISFQLTVVLLDFHDIVYLYINLYTICFQKEFQVQYINKTIKS